MSDIFFSGRSCPIRIHLYFYDVYYLKFDLNNNTINTLPTCLRGGNNCKYVFYNLYLTLKARNLLRKHRHQQRYKWCIYHYLMSQHKWMLLLVLKK